MLSLKVFLRNMISALTFDDYLVIFYRDFFNNIILIHQINEIWQMSSAWEIRLDRLKLNRFLSNPGTLVNLTTKEALEEFHCFGRSMRRVYRSDFTMVSCCLGMRCLICVSDLSNFTCKHCLGKLILSDFTMTFCFCLELGYIWFIWSNLITSQILSV